MSAAAGFVAQWRLATISERRDLAKQRLELKKEALYELQDTLYSLNRSLISDQLEYSRTQQLTLEQITNLETLVSRCTVLIIRINDKSLDGLWEQMPKKFNRAISGKQAFDKEITYDIYGTLRKSLDRTNDIVRTFIFG